MGLLNFVRNIGKKIFDNEDTDIAEKIKTHIETDKLGVNNLQVNYEDGVVKLSGEAKSSTDLEKAVLLAGNLQGVESVNIDNVSGEQPVETVEYYIIEKGDSLWKIAEKTYGNGSQYEKIFEENREVIKDPNLIFPGQKIRIPK